MKALKISLITSLFLCLGLSVKGQNNTEGNTLQNPVDLGTKNQNFTYSTGRMPMMIFTDTYGVAGPDMFIKATLSCPMEIEIIHADLNIHDSYLHILNSAGVEIAYNDNNYGNGASNPLMAYIKTTLAAGTYYFVTEGKGCTGYIGVIINGTVDFGYSVAPSTTSSQSGPVGAMGGSFGVSPLGGATYSIPIEVPVGVGGAAPQLSITYNSQAGNGLCGYGANLSGFSSITRAPKDAYHDNAAQGIKYLADDALYLDGTRLLLSSGTAGQDGSIYNPESDPFTKVITHGTCISSSNNIWFEVQSSDGMVYWYTTQLSYNKGSSQRIHSWYLTRAIQPAGNYVEYYYDQSEYYVYPILIAYGDNINQSNALSNTISFVYEDRDDVIPVHFDGKKGSFNKRLKTITCKTSEQVFRTYTLTYDTIGDGTEYKYSRLTSVSEANGQNESLPATQFTWSYLPSTSHTADHAHIVTPGNLQIGASYKYTDQTYLAGDMNGDGLTDIIGVGPVGDEAVVEIFYAEDYQGQIYYYTSGSHGDYETTLNEGVFMRLDATYSRENSITDLDGDGINELVLCFYDGVENDYGDLVIDVHGQNINSGMTTIRLDRPQPPLVTTGGLFNDGKNQVLVLESQKNTNMQYRLRVLKLNDNYNNSGNRMTVINNFSLTFGDDPAQNNRPKQMYVTDMNGNGLSDLLILCEGGYKILWNKGNTSAVFDNNYSTDGFAYNTFGNEWMRTAGDFNGDGLLDILSNATGSTIWNFHLNNGDGTFTTQQACVLPLEMSEHSYTDRDDDKFHCRVLDFDGDGRDDVVITKAEYEKKYERFLWHYKEWGVFQKTHTMWMRSTGNTLKLQYDASSKKEEDAYPRRYLTADFDGDGYVELMNFGYNCKNGNYANVNPQFYVYKHDGLTPQSGKITSINGDYGSTTNITYSTLTDYNVYSKGETGTYPVISYTFPLNVVKNTIQDNGAAEDIITNYSYSGLKVHLHGKGLLGFNATQANNTTMGTTVKTEITAWNNTYYVPGTTKTTTTVGGKTSQSQNTLAFVNKGGKKYFAYPSQTVDTDFDGNSVTTTRTFNTTYGYLTNENVSYGTNMYKSVSYSDYVLAGKAYRPRTVTKSQRHSDDSSPYSNTTKYTYDTGTGLIIKDTVNYGTTKPLITQYTYDIWGNLTSQVSSGIGVSDIITYYSYDGTHRFPERIYTNNPLSSVQKYSYNIWGNVMTEQDSINSNNNITTHTYDNWGNRVSTQVPGYGMVTYTRGWGSDNNKRYFVLKQGTSLPWVKTWYDNQGRVVKTESIGPKDVTISTTTTYNNKGLKSGETEITGNLTLSHSYSYDARGRLTSETHPGNNTISYSYGSNGMTKTVNDNGRSTTYTYDVMGDLKTVQSPLSSTLTHWYSSNGKVKKTVSDGITWTFGFDDCGNRTSIVDPDAGTTTFTYDAFGREILRIDGSSRSYATDYDIFGRVTYDGTTTFTYGTSGNGQNRLVSESNGQWTKSYIYDTYGRVTQETMVKYAQTTKSMSYQYNATGLLIRKDYPNNTSVSYEYDSYGNCTKLNFNNGSMVWELTGNNGKTTTSSVKIGNSTPFVRTTQLDNYGNLQSRAMTVGNTSVQNDNYVFNPRTGNLTSRTLTGHATENFTYDNLDRLMREQSSEIDLQMSYTTKGNINEKTDVGQYHYPSGNAHAHAVDYIDVNPYADVPDFNQYIEYDYRNKPDCLAYSIDGNDYWYTMEYGPNHQRVKSRLENDGVLVREKFYWDEYEEYIANGTTTSLYWIEAPDGLAGLIVNYNNEDYYAYVAMTDHLGSLTRLSIYDGEPVFEASYDAWGKRTVAPNSLPIDRGFTGHEHIDELALINMNGRMYDPMQALFLSPDPYIQNQSNPQNYNRYSYCLNNPLKYTDPSGEFFLEAVAISAIIGGINGAVIGNKAGATGGKMLGYIAGGAFVGALSGGIAQGISMIGGGAVISGAGGGLISGLGNSLLTGGDVAKGMTIGALTGGLGGAVGSAIGGGLGAFAGGAVATGSCCFAYGGRGSDVALSALGGGLLSCGIYGLTTYGGWKSGGNKMGDFDITYKQYKTMQADMQRSRFWSHEYGGILTTDGDIVRAPAKYRHNFVVDFDPEWTRKASGRELTTYHTHWAKPGQTYTIDSNFDKADYGYSAITSKGPSGGDYTFAGQNGMNHLLFDRTNSYVYWGDEVNRYILRCGTYFSMRYLPLYMFY